MSQKGMENIILGILCMAATSAAAEGVNNTKPNIIIIMADDLGYSDVSLYGRADVRTPHIDRIGKEGITFPNIRANCTVCSPSRAALLTGKFPDRVGVPGVIRTETDNTWGYLSQSVHTLPDYLKQAGYHTALIGKWHLGLEEPNIPNSRGFDFFHGFLGDMMDSYTTHLRHGHNYMRKNREVIKPTGHATDLFTDWTCDYSRERANETQTPFFLFLAYNAPHGPIQPPADWLAKIKERDPSLSPKRAAIVALIEHLDDGIGKVLDALKENGLDQNTIVAVTSDNGGALEAGSCNDPWRGGKQDFYDGGLRVPFVLRWPAKVKPGTQCDYAGLVFDLFPTALDVAGTPLPTDLDARSLVPIFEGGGMNTPARELYFVRREGGPKYAGKSYEAIIHGDWKLMQNDPFSPLQLFNLKDDPQEKTDLAKQDTKRVREMSNALRARIQAGGVAPWGKPE
jgi:arylsulfatase A-like enzyme